MKFNRHIPRIIALVALCILIYPSILFLSGIYMLRTVQWIMLLATLVWFISASFWMGRSR